MYGKKTGATPDGRSSGEAFAPCPYARTRVAIASLTSVAKLRYRDSQDGISNTFSIVPNRWVTEQDRVENLVTMLDGYFTRGHTTSMSMS